MKNFLFLGLIIPAVSCGKKEEINIAESAEQENIAPYDTIATDSFSAGATPNNVILQRDTVISAKKDSLPKSKPEKASHDEKVKEKLKKPELKEQPKPEPKKDQPNSETEKPTP